MQDEQYYRLLIINLLNTLTIKTGEDCSQNLEVIDNLIEALNKYKDELTGENDSDFDTLSVEEAEYIMQNFDDFTRFEIDDAANILIDAYKQGLLKNNEDTTESRIHNTDT